LSARKNKDVINRTRNIRIRRRRKKKSGIRKKVQNSNGRRRLSRRLKRKVRLGIHEEKVTEET